MVETYAVGAGPEAGRLGLLSADDGGGMATRVGVRLIPVDRETGQARVLSDLGAHVAWYGPMPRWGKARDAKPAALLEEIERSGLRGRGGGWFPTARKMRAVIASAAERSSMSSGRKPVLIANAMEGEPASTKDAVLLSHAPHLVLDGMVAAAAAVGAKEAYIALHRGSAVIAVVDAAIAQRKDPVKIRLITPPARYVASEESALAHWAGNGLAVPVFDERPFEHGMNGRPTLVQNAETLAHLALIARHGGQWFADRGDPQAPGTTLVSVGGSVAYPGVIEVPTGTPVDEILRLCGGLTGPVDALLTGGYGGAWVRRDELLAVPWSPEPVSAVGGVIGAGILWALSSQICPMDEIASVAHWMAGESAGQCGPCRFGLPSVADDLALLAGDRVTSEDTARLKRRLGLVINRGACKHPDGVVRFVSTGLHAFAPEVAMHLNGRCGATAITSPRQQGRLPLPAGREIPVKAPGKDFQ